MNTKLKLKVMYGSFWIVGLFLISVFGYVFSQIPEKWEYLGNTFGTLYILIHLMLFSIGVFGLRISWNAYLYEKQLYEKSEI